MEHVTKRTPRKQVSFRMLPAGITLIDAIAAADENVERSDLLRVAVGEWLGRRAADCTREHRGPIAKGACGHCGKEVAT